MAASTNRARLVAEARELRALGLDAATVAGIVQRSAGWVYRATGGVEFTGLLPDAGRLTTPRGRAIYAAMIRTRRTNRDLALARVEERVARVVALAGADRPEGRDVGAQAATRADSRVGGEA